MTTAGDPQIPVQSATALLVAVAATLAEADEQTSEAFLARVEWWLENPYENLPTLLLHEEEALRTLVQILRIGVRRARELGLGPSS